MKMGNIYPKTSAERYTPSSVSFSFCSLSAFLSALLLLAVCGWAYPTVATLIISAINNLNVLALIIIDFV